MANSGASAMEQADEIEPGGAPSRLNNTRMLPLLMTHHFSEELRWLLSWLEMEAA